MFLRDRRRERITMTQTTLLVFLMCALIHGTYAVRGYYATNLCPGTAGPSYGEHLMFDPQQRNSNRTMSWHVPEKDLDCWVTLRGQNRLSSTAVYKLEFRFKGTFSIRGYAYGTTNRLPSLGGNVTGTDCETAYIEIYNATDAGHPDSVPMLGPTCGTIQLPTYSSFSQSMIVHVFVAAVPEYLLSTTPAPTTTTPVPTTADPSITMDPNATTTTTLAPTTTPVPTPYERCLAIGKCPYVKFSADFTSYLAYGCYEDGQINDDDQIYCLTGRCIHVSLLCDGQNSNNCGDWSDQIGSACSRPTRPPPINTYVDLTPLWIGLGAGIGSLMVLYYCCWRPGWIPWRLARLRNTYFGRLLPCCRTWCRKSACGGIGCCRPTVGKWRNFTTKFHTQTESQFPDVPHNPDRYRKLPLVDRLTCCFRNSQPNPDCDSNGNKLSGGPWMNFACDDGMHIRELR